MLTLLLCLTAFYLSVAYTEGLNSCLVLSCLNVLVFSKLISSAWDLHLVPSFTLKQSSAGAVNCCCKTRHGILSEGSEVLQKYVICLKDSRLCWVFYYCSSCMFAEWSHVEYALDVWKCNISRTFLLGCFKKNETHSKSLNVVRKSKLKPLCIALLSKHYKFFLSLLL